METDVNTLQMLAGLDTVALDNCAFTCIWSNGWACAFSDACGITNVCAITT